MHTALASIDRQQSRRMQGLVCLALQEAAAALPHNQKAARRD